MCKLFKFYIAISLVFGMNTVTWSLEGDALELKSKISELNSLTSSFEQQIKDEDDLVLETYEGSLKLNSKNRSFRMETLSPDKSILNCDGKSIYYYEPEINQVTIFSMDKVDGSSPFWIVLSDNDEAYNRFNIKANKGNDGVLDFILTPKNSGDNSSYTLHFDNEGLLSVTMLDANKQKISYNLKDRKFIKTLGSVEFVFTVPSGATVDDQR